MAPLSTGGRRRLIMRAGYSFRRFYIDDFFARNLADLRANSDLLDLGGERRKLRGLFDAAMLGHRLTTVNIRSEAGADIVADATTVPLPDASFDAVVIGELLEHVPDPRAVLAEARRLMRPGGTAFVTVPFNYPIHADPDDWGRYTDTYWRDAAQRAGFSSCRIERQGALFAVLGDICKKLALALIARPARRPWRGIRNRILELGLRPVSRLLLFLDSIKAVRTSKDLTAWTTGFGLVLTA